ncbi:Hypothetical protein I595_1360 [Croceitalea dokdonensis DOKDO 023]|uniref:Uncharacterized protein n=1 Tax=Croceitalea dokdonensis DOKDO 023 TaxID=1300341 RepID=A0A0P7A7W6_9FLAO|nr:hypothetical protein [Croceitalea dokdonensis]KPM32933.1 Hypothetical protein I595_1360 [Croceitalea dokdonensis DOKDO 023]
MIKFFRKIRQKLLAENRFSKYLFYAAGEIILVMVGILLALQVNDWNTKRLLKSKEQVYLQQIRISLNNDLENIKETKEFNALKASYIDSTFIALEQSSNPEKYVPTITNYIPRMTEFAVFYPNSIAFENMTASENIDLITNTELRKDLSIYYKIDFVNSTQERIKEQTRQFADDIFPKLGNKQTLKQFAQHDSHLRDISEVSIHTDVQVYTHLLNMAFIMDSQNELLDATIEDIKRLLDLIKANLKS